MSKTLTQSIALLGTLCALTVMAADVSAQTVRVRCETRSDRSRASVDGNNLASGMYSAVLTSGGNSAQSPSAHTVGDEAEFDFDSNPKDIRKGATPIAKDFIVGGMATGSILDTNGNVVATDTVKCRKH
jgi:hypothetical protein